jgi:hypothetical protein
MKIETLPTLFDGTAFYNFSVLLGDNLFKIKLRNNSRDGLWYLSLETEAGRPLKGATGIRLVVGWDTLRLCSDTERPVGKLIVIGPLDRDPGLYDLGASHVLQYVTFDEPAHVEAVLYTEPLQ